MAVMWWLWLAARAEGWEECNRVKLWRRTLGQKEQEVQRAKGLGMLRWKVAGVEEQSPQGKV